MLIHSNATFSDFSDLLGKDLKYEILKNPYDPNILVLCGAKF